MKIIEFTGSFIKSMNKLSLPGAWWYKVWEVVRYGIPGFFRNLWFFRTELYRFRAYDFGFNAHLLKRSIEATVLRIENGHEVEHSRDKKVVKMRRLLKLMEDYCEDNYIGMAEKELGYEMPTPKWEFEVVDGRHRLKDNETEDEKEKTTQIVIRSRELAEVQWKEMWAIISGQNIKEYVELKEHRKELSYEESEDLYDNWFDGTDARGWWD